MNKNSGIFLCVFGCIFAHVVFYMLTLCMLTSETQSSVTRLHLKLKKHLMW